MLVPEEKTIRYLAFGRFSSNKQIERRQRCAPPFNTPHIKGSPLRCWPRFGLSCACPVNRLFDGQLGIESAGLRLHNEPIMGCLIHLVKGQGTPWLPRSRCEVGGCAWVLPCVGTLTGDDDTCRVHHCTAAGGGPTVHYCEGGLCWALLGTLEGPHTTPMLLP